MANDNVNLARAALGQGLGMGWGDEAEAWLRSKLGDESYENLLRQIRSEYSAYSSKNPMTATAAEFGGAALPGVGLMLMPGGQAAGAQYLSRATIPRMAAIGGATGAVSGAGSATEGGRISGALGGGVLGTAVGGVVPLAVAGGSAVRRWLADRLRGSSDEYVTRQAGTKLAEALRQSNVTPAQLQRRMSIDRRMGVPSTVANVSPGSAKLAEAVAQRTGRGAEKIEQTLGKQRAGARERTYYQAQRALKPGDFYDDAERLVNEMRQKARGAYEAAYQAGEVDDPRIMQALNTPQFKAFFNKAREIADIEATAAGMRGEDPAKFALRQIYTPGPVDPATGVQDMVLTQMPDVRTLDYIKRGIDASIEAGFRSGKGMSTAEASALRDLSRQFVNAIDENVPEYAAARKIYAGDAEVLGALRSGMEDFGKLDHEQVIKLVAKMSPAEKDAFRTGVARDLYSKIMTPSGNFNAAQRLIGSPEMQAKLQPLFDNPSQFRFFKNALEREAQLFHQSTRILGGSQTAARQQMRQTLEEPSGVGQAAADAMSGTFWGSLTNMAARLLRNADITEQTADKLADMLMSSKPTEVASVVRVLEAAGQALPKREAAQAAVTGAATTGTIGSFWPTPYVEEPVPQEDLPYLEQPATDQTDYGMPVD